MKKKFNIVTMPNWITATLIGTAVATVFSTGLTALIANMVLNGNISEAGTGPIVFAIRLLSVAVGGLIGTSLSKEKYLPVIGVTTAGYLVILFSIGIVFFDGSFNRFGSGLLSALLGGTIASLMRLRPQKNKKHATRVRR